MSGVLKYETRPIQSWEIMKELRRNHFRRWANASESGNLIVMMVHLYCVSLFAGFGEDWASPNYGPQFTRMMRDPNRAIKTIEKAEEKGFVHEMCSSMRCHIGQYYSGISDVHPITGKPYKPDLVFQFQPCKSQSKTGQFFAERLGVPFRIVDWPIEDTPHAREYILGQLHEAIPWMEKITGRKYDDEKLIQATRNEWRSTVLWGKICNLCKAVPAPLDARMLLAVRLPIITGRERKDVADYLQVLYEEVKERVRDGISARGVEKVRLLYEGIVPFFESGLIVLRMPERYGAIVVGGELFFNTFGAYDVLDDGSWMPTKDLDERGVVLRTRDDALRSLVELYMKINSTQYQFRLGIRPKIFVKRAKDWHCQGAIFELDRGCKGAFAGLLEARLAMEDAGIRTMLHEGSNADPRDFDAVAVASQISAFCESMGLTKLDQAKSRDKEESVD